MGGERHRQRVGKAWNRKGSRTAKEHMAGLRHTKLQHQKRDLIHAWARATGRPAKEWWDDAQAAGLVAGCGPKASIEFLTAALAKAQGAPS